MISVLIVSVSVFCNILLLVRCLSSIVERDRFRKERNEAHNTLRQIAEDVSKWDVYLGESPLKLTRLAANISANKILDQMPKQERNQIFAQALQNSKNFAFNGRGAGTNFRIVGSKKARKKKATKKK